MTINNSRYKYGLLVYDTENIGDEIQSIAARRFLPQIDYLFNRDRINNTKIHKNDRVKLIMNGWFMGEPYDWPPQNNQIEPLLLSMYVERNNHNNKTEKYFFSKKSMDYLRANGPIGARDLGTLSYFKKKKLDSYFSGCLTLTLLPNPSIKTQDYILAVDVSEAILKKIIKSTHRKVLVLNTERNRNLTYEEKMVLAEYWLSMYQSAHLVVTTRLHCMLPCLAFNTPVYAIKKNDLRRFGGLINLVNSFSEDDFIKKRINFEHPKTNPKKYLALRDKLVKTCSGFTGFDSGASFLREKSILDLYDSTNFKSAINKLAHSSYRGQIDSENQLAEIKRLQNKISMLDSRINAQEEQVIALQNLGIRASTKSLISAIGRKIKK